PIDRSVGQSLKDQACRLREEFTRNGTLVVNIVSSPGAGKTALLEATAKHWAGRHRVAVLVGDIATERDAERLAPYLPVRQLTTGGACHLELPLVRKGLDELGNPPLDFLFIENIGNLVCPASHDLAEHLRVVLLSTTEGDDKPGKYPKMFRTSQVLVISKTDLLPYVPFSVDNAETDARIIQPDIQTVSVSARTGEGVAKWCDLLIGERQRLMEGR
ncbi:MAG TPA: hydrogenase nickel incorporation protein HypB, partial [Caulifigura sp.]|nr:hydrogenase nickel incorporation protein HypB [Caulifigura sp.]